MHTLQKTYTFSTLSWLEYLNDDSFKQQAARYENFLEGQHREPNKGKVNWKCQLEEFSLDQKNNFWAALSGSQRRFLAVRLVALPTWLGVWKAWCPRNSQGNGSIPSHTHTSRTVRYEQVLLNMHRGGAAYTTSSIQSSTRLKSWVYACNPRVSGCWGRGNTSSRPAWATESQLRDFH